MKKIQRLMSPRVPAEVWEKFDAMIAERGIKQNEWVTQAVIEAVTPLVLQLTNESIQFDNPIGPGEIVFTETKEPEDWLEDVNEREQEDWFEEMFA